MSQDDSYMPAPESAPTVGSTDRRLHPSVRNTPLIVGAVLALVVGTLAFVLFRGGGDSSDAAANCVQDEVLLTTAPAMKELIAKAVKAVEADQECLNVKVSEGTLKDVVATLKDRDGVMPELWIPDSPTWQGQLSAAGWSGSPIVEVAAQTPVGLVGGPTAKAPASWTDALRGGRMIMADPSVEGASALALLAPLTELKSTGQTADGIKQITAPLAQAFGERAIEGQQDSTDLAGITATSTQMVPVTEQAYLAARRGNDQLTLVAPRTGVPMLQYPILQVAKGIKAGAGGAGAELPARAGRALSRWFASEDGQSAVAEAEFRTAGTNELGDGVGLGKSRVLPKVAQEATDEAMRNWRVLSVPSSMMAVIDLSASMKERLADVSRIEMAVNAAQVGLEILPGAARIGLWGFSKNRGSDGQTWEEYTPMTRLDLDVDGSSAREVLSRELNQMPSRVHGGTGLFDTVLASYKNAQKEWDPAYFNSLVIMTDGAADDSSEMSSARLVEFLKQARDPSRPITVVIFGLSPEANTPEMQQLADATGGQFFPVSKPDDMLGALGQTLMNR